MNGSLTTLFLPEEELVSLPQRPKPNQNLTSFHRAESLSSSKKKSSSKKLSGVPKSDSNVKSSSSLDRVDMERKNSKGKCHIGSRISNYSATNQFSSDPITPTTTCGSLTSRQISRTRSWSEASESDSSLSPIRRDLLNLGLQNPTDSSWDTDNDCETPRKLARSWSQSSVHSDSSAGSQVTMSVMTNLNSFPSSMSNSTMIAAVFHDCDVPLNYHYHNCMDQSHFSSNHAYSLQGPIQPMYPSHSNRYCAPSEPSVLDNDLDYTTIWNQNDDFQFRSRSQEYESEKRGCMQEKEECFVATWSRMAERDSYLLADAAPDGAHSDDGIAQGLSFDSGRTNRDEPLSDCDSEERNFPKNEHEQCCHSDEDIEDDVDLLSDLGSLMSLSLIDLDEESMSLTAPNVHKASTSSRVSDAMVTSTALEEGEELDDLLLTSHTICNVAGILDYGHVKPLVNSRNEGAPNSNAPVGTNHALLSRTLSSSDVQRLARAALLGEDFDPLPMPRTQFSGARPFPIPPPIVTVNSTPTTNQYIPFGSTSKSPNRNNATVKLAATGVSPMSLQRQQLRQRQQMKRIALTHTHISPRHYRMHTSPRYMMQQQVMARSPHSSNSCSATQKKIGGDSYANYQSDGDIESERDDEDDDGSVFALLHTE